jgi:DNA repair ATPase RecN
MVKMFLFSAKKGLILNIKKVASGGEMSRIMLAVKQFEPIFEVADIGF